MKIDFKVLRGGSVGFHVNRYIQSWIYSLLKGTEIDFLHDKKGFKYFCFSNLFPPPKDCILKKGMEISLIIASPVEEIVDTIDYSIRERHVVTGREVTLGDIKLDVFDLRKINLVELKDGFTIVTETPVIVRIPKERYAELGISSKRPQMYWIPRFGIQVFIDAVYTGLNKKHIDLFGAPLPTKHIFQDMEKTGVEKIRIKWNNTFEIKMYGSYWRLKYRNPTAKQRHAIRFMLDTGIGERTSLGFGFLNPRPNNKAKNSQ